MLWIILEDEEGDDFLLESEETDQRVMRPLCSDADCRRKFLHDMINGHPTQCHNMLRLWPEIFTKLCSDLQDMYGLRDTYNMSVKENVAIFLHMCGHNITQQTAMHTFGHSAETISRKFHEVLVALVSWPLICLLQIRRLLCKFILNCNQISIIGHISKDLLVQSMELIFLLWCLEEIKEDIGIGMDIHP